MSVTRNERQLIVGLAAGSREACERLLDLCEDRVYNLCRRMVGEQDSEDVAQEALIEICRSAPTFRGASSLTTWVHRVAVNVCLEHRRRRRPEFVPIEDGVVDLPSDPASEPSAVAVRNEVKRDLESAVRRLPEIHRDVIVLHELQGLTYQECAEVLGCPVGTVKSRLNHAFGELREMLKGYGPEGEIAQ